MQSIQILPLLLMMLVVAIAYNLLKIFVLPNIKVNKWIVLVGTLLTLIVPQFFTQLRTGIISYVFIAISVILFLWFMDLAGWGPEGIAERRNKKHDTTIKPKAKPKPNRIKHMSEKEKENLVITSKKKKRK